MSQPLLSIARLERRQVDGRLEVLTFDAGVTLLLGPPNTGKTKWLQTLDFLLGDAGDNPYGEADETSLADKYESAAVDIIVGEERFRVERRWREPGAKTKIFVDDKGLNPKEFQQWLLEKLEIPLLHYPRGNPLSGQTWPELSFRTLLRHIYRQQRFWGSLVDQQTDAEFHASLLQFLGLAEHVYTDELGELVTLKLDAERLRARRDQYGLTLGELARDLVSSEDLTVDANDATVAAAKASLQVHVDELRAHRIDLLNRAQEQALTSEQQSRVAVLGEERSRLAVGVEELARKKASLAERAQDIGTYHADLSEEIERLTRAEDAGSVFADLKITNCPACDQSVAHLSQSRNDCFLCHQHLPSTPNIAGLGAVRLRFEKERIEGERREAVELSAAIALDLEATDREIASRNGRIREIENMLIPARAAVGALAQSAISDIDVALGQASERERQLDRVAAALQLETNLTEQIAALEKRIVPLQESVDRSGQTVDFDAASSALEDGMNAYLDALNRLQPKTWRHNPVRVDLTRRSASFRVGSKRWSSALGGTDSLYYLMAYHYGLLTLSAKSGCHYPGLAIIDLPGEFLGEAVEDKENFIVQPFVDLLAQSEYAGAQLIITGASFTGLGGVHVEQLRHVYVA